MSLHILKGTSSLQEVIFQCSWNNIICLSFFSAAEAMCYKKEKDGRVA